MAGTRAIAVGQGLWEGLRQAPGTVGVQWPELRDSAPCVLSIIAGESQLIKRGGAGPVTVSYFWMHYSYLINHLEAATLLAYKAHYMVLNC